MWAGRAINYLQGEETKEPYPEHDCSLDFNIGYGLYWFSPDTVCEVFCNLSFRFSIVPRRTKALAVPKIFEVAAQLTKPSQSILVCIASVSYLLLPRLLRNQLNLQESVAGVTVTSLHKPNLDPKEYPTMDTRPGNSIVTFFLPCPSTYLILYPTT